MNVSSIVIQARNEYIEDLVEKLKRCDFCDYHFHDASIGKIIVTVEGDGIEEEMKKVKQIEELDHVVCAEMMMAYSEDELDKEREKLQQSDIIPEVLIDDTVSVDDIEYHGDLKKKL